MDKKFIPIIIVIAIIVLIFLSIFGIQMISTDKAVYESGESVKINITNFSLLSMSCGFNPKIEVLEDGSWRKIQKEVISMGSRICVNGEVQDGWYGCDVVSLGGPEFRSGETIWDGTEYIETESNDCSDFGDIRSFEHKSASVGSYRVSAGFATTTFEIK